jgi:hypothetical protein
MRSNRSADKAKKADEIKWDIRASHFLSQSLDFDHDAVDLLVDQVAGRSEAGYRPASIPGPARLGTVWGTR